MNFDVSIDPKEFNWSFVRSSGPGGQNVNKTNTCAVLTWNIPESKSLTEEVKSRLLQKLAHQITQLGEIQIRSQSNRSQGLNQEDCVKKLYELLARALFVPKKRVKTKPTKSSVRRRLKNKSHHGEKKANRTKKNWD